MDNLERIDWWEKENPFISKTEGLFPFINRTYKSNIFYDKAPTIDDMINFQELMEKNYGKKF